MFRYFAFHSLLYSFRTRHSFMSSARPFLPTSPFPRLTASPYASAVNTASHSYKAQAETLFGGSAITLMSVTPTGSLLDSGVVEELAGVSFIELLTTPNPRTSFVSL